MRKFFCFLVFFGMTASVFSQVREDTVIHIPQVIAVRYDHAAFFKENFDMEVAAAGYTLTENVYEADFILRLQVMENTVIFDDGSIERAPEGEPLYLLHITLIQAEYYLEMLSFAFPFTELEEMFQHNLALVYQAMANVPITRLSGEPIFITTYVPTYVTTYITTYIPVEVPVEVLVEVPAEDVRWRNKWLYFRASVEYPVAAFYQARNLPGNHTLHQTTRVMLMPGIILGVELQFLNWMSVETGFIMRLGGDWDNYVFLPGIHVQLKFPIKPATHFKISPYIMGITQGNTGLFYSYIPPAAVGGGIQFGTRGGSRGAFFLDVNFLYSIGTIRAPSSSLFHPFPPGISWNRFALGIGLGYKVGFSDRPSRN